MSAAQKQPNPAPTGRRPSPPPAPPARKSTSRTVIVHGPMASGKTYHAEELRHLFGCKRVVDGWDGRSPLRRGDLALTNESPPFAGVDAEVISIGEAVGNLR